MHGAQLNAPYNHLTWRNNKYDNIYKTIIRRNNPYYKIMPYPVKFHEKTEYMGEKT